MKYASNARFPELNHKTAVSMMVMEQRRTLELARCSLFLTHFLVYAFSNILLTSVLLEILMIKVTNIAAPGQIPPVFLVFEYSLVSH